MDGTTPVHEAAKHARNARQCIKEFEFIAADLDEKDSDGGTPLYYAVARGDTLLVQYLLKNNASIQKSTKSPPALIIAATYGMLPIVQTLLDNGAQKHVRNMDGQTALICTAGPTKEGRGGHPDIARLLISRGCDPYAVDRHNWSVMHYAASSNQEDIVQVLDGHFVPGLQVPRTCRWHDTPLHTAVSAGHQRIVTRLLEQGFSPNAQQRSGESALHLAIEWCREDSATSLIDADVDVEMMDENGETALHYTARRGQHRVLRAILQKNRRRPFVEKQDKLGNTALMLAVTYSHYTCIETLLAKGADRHSRNNLSLCALDVASQLQDSKIKEAFEALQAP